MGGGTWKPEAGTLSQRDVGLNLHAILAMDFVRQERWLEWKREKNHVHNGTKITVVATGGTACFLTWENFTVPTSLWQRLFSLSEKLGGVGFCHPLSSGTNIYWVPIFYDYIYIQFHPRDQMQNYFCFLLMVPLFNSSGNKLRVGKNFSKIRMTLKPTLSPTLPPKKDVPSENGTRATVGKAWIVVNLLNTYCVPDTIWRDLHVLMS